MQSLIMIVIIVVAIVILIRISKTSKKLRIGALVLVTGGVKVGKTSLSLYIARKEYRSRLIEYYLKKIFAPNKNKDLEKPLFYSNIPLYMDYVPLTEDLLLRKKRFAYKSIIYVCEASLVADSQLFHDMTLNDKLLLFNKLIGHETKGGCLVYDTQCLQDVHYSIKRSVSNYIYINSLDKHFPFILRANVKEYINLGDNSGVVSVNTNDLEDEMKYVYFPKKVWKYFDTYCYSSLTDNLEVENNVTKKTKDLKVKKIVTFKKGGFN